MQNYDINPARYAFEASEDFKAWAMKRNHFIENLCPAEFHWFFDQGLEAIQHGLFIPGVSSLFNGIEASLRVTIAQVNTNGTCITELSPYNVLSNKLIKTGLCLGMPVDKLAFPDETNFREKLTTEKPNQVHVEVVRQRNNICHGNVFEFINDELGSESAFFTPECLKPLAFKLLDVSYGWVEELGKYRRSRSISVED